MKFVIGLVLLITAAIEGRGIPKLQIYEIRDRGDNAIELRDLSSRPSSQRNVESQLLRLLSPKKRSKSEDGVTRQLIDKLTGLKGDEGNRIGDDAFVYVLQDIFNGNNQNKASSEEVFVDKTRDDNNERSELHISNILDSLLRKSQKKPKHKKRGAYILRSEVGQDKIMAPVPYDYNESIYVSTPKAESSDSI